MVQMKNIFLRSLGRFMLVYHYIYHFSRTAFFPQHHVGQFHHQYENVRNFLMSHGLKMLSPLQTIQGHEIFPLILISVIVLMLCLMFMLGDNRGNVFVIILLCLQSYSISHCFEMVLFYLGLMIWLVGKPYLEKKDSQNEGEQDVRNFQEKNSSNKAQTVNFVSKEEEKKKQHC